MISATIAKPTARSLAIVITQMGREQSNRLIQQLDPKTLEAIMAEVARLDRVDPEEAIAAVKEVHGMVRGDIPTPVVGGLDVARNLLSSSLSGDAADDMLSKIASAVGRQPFEFLQQADLKQVVTLLQNEHPQIVAIVLAHLKAETSSKILGALPPKLQSEVTIRLSVTERPFPDAVKIVADRLRAQAGTVLAPRDQSVAMGGIQPLVEIINRSENATERAILESLDSFDKELANAVRDKMFVFDDIILLENRALTTVLRGMDAGMLALALRGAGTEQRAAIIGAVSPRVQSDIDEALQAGPARASEVEEARAQIVKKIRELEDAGQIAVRRDGQEDEYID